MKKENNQFSKRYLMKQVSKYIKPYRWWLALAFCLLLCSEFFVTLGPAMIGNAIDAIEEMGDTRDFTKLTNICKTMLVLYVSSACLTYGIARIMIYIGKSVSFQLRKDVQSRLLQLPVSYFDTKQAGDIISCLSYDIGVLNTSLTNDLLQVATSMITVVFSMIMMIRISPILVIVMLIMIPVMVIFARYRLKKTKPLFRARSKKLGELNGFAEETLSGIKTIIGYQKQDVMNERFVSYNDSASEFYYHADYQGSKMGPVSGFIGNVALSCIGLFGSILFVMGRISVGDLSAFVIYSRKFTGPINELANVVGEIQSAFSAANRIFTLLEELPEPLDDADAVELTEVVGQVKVENVEFSYVPNTVVLKNMNVYAKAGKTIAIVGSTGSGKSTIINLLMRFYDYQQGEITIDGIPLTKITRESLRKSFSMVLQDTWIFQGTIFENIAYAKENATIEDVKRVAKAAKINHFIEALPDGYDTVIADEGSNLSKGQKQLISIARAMLVDASMLILDEATSNIDSGTEVLVQEAMANLMKNKTCFVIAHRLSTIKNADEILVISNGVIQEQGNHQELLQQQGYYYNMYQSQFL